MMTGSLLRVGGIIESPSIALVRMLGMPDTAGAAARAVGVFSDAGVNIEFISESADAHGTANLVVGISMSDMDRLDENLPRLRNVTSATTVTILTGCALLGLHGPQFGEIPGVAARFFGALGATGVNILAIASSLSSMCCAVSDADRNVVRKAILETFGNGR
jgi:aspartate kinase